VIQTEDTLVPSPSPGSEPAALASARCVPHARLFADHVVVTSTDGLSCALHDVLVPLVELSFDYGGTRVRAGDPRTRVFRADAAALEAVERDVAAETAARHVLERLGAVELACVETIAPPPECEADYVVRADSDEHSFCAFASRALARWRALGWLVDVASDFPFRVVESEPTWYARIEPCENRPDWFGLELGVEIDGTRVDLLPLLLDLLDRLDAEGGLESLARSCRPAWALRISGTHHLSVPVERLRALLRVVAELYQGERRTAGAFPAVRAGALLELDTAFRATGGSLSWRDRTGITERARAHATSTAPVAPPAELRATLRPYQLDGVAFLQKLRESGTGGVLADEMGLGKTLQTIAHVSVEKAAGRLQAPALIVAPTTLVANWARETARFAPHLRVVTLHGPERRTRWASVEGADLVVTTYPVLVRDEERFAGTRFHLVVLDEAQAIKNARSQARQALERVPADHRVCLTGTPVENHLGELWSLFDWLARGLLGDELSFRRFWRKPIEEHGDAERLTALRQAVGPYVLRRLKRDVARELPPKTEIGVPVELNGPQRELYESIRLAAHGDVRRAIRAKGLAASAVTILDALTKLRQACCDPRLVAMDSARTVRESAKLASLMQLLGEQLSAGHRVLVFSQFTSMLALVGEALHARSIPHLTLTGATRDRQAVVDAFEEGHADVFLISLKAGGTGLNLTSADTVVHYDPWWNPASQAQATDRAYRIGQKKPVFVHNLYAAGTVEERVLALQQRKRDIANGILGDTDAGGTRALTEGDVEQLLAPMDR
jgi:superfamily II DNA or RNA helicase